MNWGSRYENTNYSLRLCYCLFCENSSYMCIAITHSFSREIYKLSKINITQNERNIFVSVRCYKCHKQWYSVWLWMKSQISMKNLIKYACVAFNKISKIIC